MGNIEPYLLLWRNFLVNIDRGIKKK